MRKSLKFLILCSVVLATATWVSLMPTCCGGAGAEFAEEAIAQGADVFITADVKYHEMQAADGRIALVDMLSFVIWCGMRAEKSEKLVKSA